MEKIEHLEQKIDGIGKSLDKTKMDVESLKKEVIEVRAISTSAYHGYSALAERIEAIKDKQNRFEGKIDNILGKLNALPFKIFAIMISLLAVFLTAVKILK